MGRAKEAWMEEIERGYGRPDGHICSNCVKDPWLQDWINDEASVCSCSFCGAKSSQPIAASFEDFIGHVMTGVHFFWNHPDSEGIMYVSAEGGYQAGISDNSDVIWDLDVSNNDNVNEALIDSIDDNGWVSRDYYSGTEGDLLGYGWDSFKDVIKHQSRFFFLRPDEDEYDFGPEIKPHAMLDVIAEVISEKLVDYELIRSIPADTNLIRIRVDSDNHHSTASALGAPPAKYATQSNRMSPAGVPMFYGAFDASTALAETFDSDIGKDALISAGTFIPVRDLRVLDLASLPELPSIYDEEKNYLFHALAFLHSLAHDISITIKRDGREHVEYVPTQIVTEYFRRVFRFDGKPLDGIAYGSSKKKDQSAFVLFCENDQCIDGETTGNEREMLRLIDVEHTTASNHD